jgi:hypothetical protein
MLRLSQGHLNLLETCPRKFQHLYLDRLGSPNDPKLQESGEWGNRFHLMMQQQELGLPIEGLLQEDQAMKEAIAALKIAAPHLFVAQPNTFREAEHGRSLMVADYWLTVVYDLLIATPQSAQIIDWKTYPQPKQRKRIAQNWQTRLYLYVLAQTSDYDPEQLSMTYWFVRLPKEPESLTLTYNRQKHEQTHRDLTHLLAQLNQYLGQYWDDKLPFPQVPTTQQYLCDRCDFAALCQRPESQVETDWSSRLAQISEISL